MVDSELDVGARIDARARRRRMWPFLLVALLLHGVVLGAVFYWSLIHSVSTVVTVELVARTWSDHASLVPDRMLEDSEQAAPNLEGTTSLGHVADEQAEVDAPVSSVASSIKNIEPSRSPITSQEKDHQTVPDEPRNNAQRDVAPDIALGEAQGASAAPAQRESTVKSVVAQVPDHTAVEQIKQNDDGTKEKKSFANVPKKNMNEASKQTWKAIEPTRNNDVDSKKVSTQRLENRDGSANAKTETRLDEGQKDIGTTHAVGVRNPAPEYPRRAKRQGVEGTVRLRALVNFDGKVSQVEVVSSSQNRLLDEAAVRAVQGWEFKAATRAGVAVSQWVDVPISFRIK